MRPSGLARPPASPLELERRDLAPYRVGNAGIAYVHSFDSGRPGPHAMVNGLTHGNELAGMWAVTRLLDAGLRPRRGRLTLSLANVAAYECFSPESMTEARFWGRDLNRLWRDDWIDADDATPEVRRACELRPLVRTVDFLLDLHTTWYTARPFWVLPDLPKARALCDRIAVPGTQQLLPPGRDEGLHLIDYGDFLEPASPKVALTPECGTHFEGASAERACAIALRFLTVTGTLDEDEARALGAASPEATRERYVIVRPQIAESDDLVLTVPYDGFVPVRRGQLVAWDGERPVHAPFDGVVLPPRPAPRAGQVAFNWGRRMG